MFILPFPYCTFIIMQKIETAASEWLQVWDQTEYVPIFSREEKLKQLLTTWQCLAAFAGRPSPVEPTGFLPAVQLNQKVFERLKKRRLAANISQQLHFSSQKQQLQSVQIGTRNISEIAKSNANVQ